MRHFNQNQQTPINHTLELPMEEAATFRFSRSEIRIIEKQDMGTPIEPGNDKANPFRSTKNSEI